MAARSRKDELDALRAQLPAGSRQPPRGAPPAPEPEDQKTAEAEALAAADAEQPEAAAEAAGPVCGAARAALERACCSTRRHARAAVIAHPMTSVTAAFVAGLLLARTWR